MASQRTSDQVDEAEEPEEPGTPSESGEPDEPGLWHHRDFLKLWAGQSTSLIGSQVSVVALPLVAVILLDASTLEFGILGTFLRLPMVLFPFVGVWVDRVRRRQVMLWSDIARAGILSTIPLLWWAGALTMGWMYVAVLILGFFFVLFEIAYRSYLPSLVSTRQLGDGNSKLQLSDSVSRTAGPGLASILLGWWSAATVIVVDVVTYVVSAIALLFIRKPEPKPTSDDDAGQVMAAIWAGLRWVMRQPLIRPLALGSAVYCFFEIGVLQALYVKFVVDEPGLPATWVGFILATGGAGAIVGAFFSARLMDSIGPGPTMLACTVIGNTSLLLVPLAGGPRWTAATMLVVSQVSVNLTTQIFVVNHITMIQTITPPAMRGRVVATIWSLGLVPAPLGALFGGILGEAVGLRPTLLVAVVVGGLVPILLILFSPIPRLRTMPEGPIDETPAEPQEPGPPTETAAAAVTPDAETAAAPSSAEEVT